MPLLRDDPDLLEAAFGAVAAASSIPLSHIDKDYWLTECLRGLAGYAEAQKVPVILKGGTSLSKAFGLIQRFSEDADLLVIFGDESRAQRDRFFKAAVAAAETTSGLRAVSDDQQSERGVTRVVTLEYPHTAPQPIAPRVKVELHTVGGGLPQSTTRLRSLLAEHWAHVGLAASYDELADFSMPVLDPCRTLMEKLVLLHEAHTRDGGSAVDRIRVTVRHYFDVWRLLGDERVMAELERHGAPVLARDVATYSAVAGYKTVDRPPSGFADSPAFGPPRRATREAYERVMAVMAWSDHAHVPSLDECLARVREQADKL